MGTHLRIALLRKIRRLLQRRDCWCVWIVYGLSVHPLSGTRGQCLSARCSTQAENLLQGWQGLQGLQGRRERRGEAVLTL